MNAPNINDEYEADRVEMVKDIIEGDFANLTPKQQELRKAYDGLINANIQNGSSPEDAIKIAKEKFFSEGIKQKGGVRWETVLDELTKATQKTLEEAKTPEGQARKYIAENSPKPDSTLAKLKEASVRLKYIMGEKNVDRTSADIALSQVTQGVREGNIKERLLGATEKLEDMARFEARVRMKEIKEGTEPDPTKIALRNLEIKTANAMISENPNVSDENIAKVVEKRVGDAMAQANASRQVEGLRTVTLAEALEEQTSRIKDKPVEPKVPIKAPESEKPQAAVPAGIAEENARAMAAENARAMTASRDKDPMKGKSRDDNDPMRKAAVDAARGAVPAMTNNGNASQSRMSEAPPPIPVPARSR